MNKLKTLLLAFAMLFVSQLGMAQDSTYVTNEYAKALAMYNRAQRYNDALMSKQALLELAVINPRDTAVLKNLAELYFSNGQYVSSAIVSQDITNMFPNDSFALEIAAISYENLRLYDKAIENYEALWLATDKATILYQVSYLQYALNRYEEAIANLNILSANVKEDEVLNLSKEDGTNQDVLFNAAIANLKGLIALGQEDNASARAFFTKALELSPDFEAAQNSLNDMN